MAKITPAEFVSAWQGAATLQEVAGKLGMTLEKVAMRAAHYRRRGVRLKAMGKPGRKPLDVVGLNKLIERLK